MKIKRVLGIYKAQCHVEASLSRVDRGKAYSHEGSIGNLGTERSKEGRINCSRNFNVNCIVEKIIPKSLSKGDHIRVIAPSRSMSIIAERDVAFAVKLMNELGYIVS